MGHTPKALTTKQRRFKEFKSHAKKQQHSLASELHNAGAAPISRRLRQFAPPVNHDMDHSGGESEGHASDEYESLSDDDSPAKLRQQS